MVGYWKKSELVDKCNQTQKQTITNIAAQEHSPEETRYPSPCLRHGVQFLHKVRATQQQTKQTQNKVLGASCPIHHPMQKRNDASMTLTMYIHIYIYIYIYFPTPYRKMCHGNPRKPWNCPNISDLIAIHAEWVMIGGEASAGWEVTTWAAKLYILYIYIYI